jgi:hypothetical protein
MVHSWKFVFFNFFGDFGWSIAKFSIFAVRIAGKGARDDHFKSQ